MTDDPHYFAYSPCWSCKRPFSYNPHLVPSVPVDPATNTITPGGVRQPICRECATAANVNRAEAGLPLWNVSDKAYGLVQGLPE
jgi:hypothetical protein